MKKVFLLISISLMLVKVSTYAQAPNTITAVGGSNGSNMLLNISGTGGMKTTATFSYDNGITFNALGASPNYSFNSAGTTKMFISSDGNIGLGTASPGAKLSFGNLNDGRNAPDGITWYSPSPLAYGIYRTSGAWTAPNYQQLKLSWSTGIIIDGGSAYGLSGTVLQPNGGNVGIGTINNTVNGTTYKLAVSGSVVATSMDIVGTVPASDYVFEPSYKLRSLSETENFVKENKHLPEVPSAKEFKEKGYSIGQMDDILLRKIEELTLYMIELKKDNDALKAKVQNLENK
jgi:hypothetical protein